MKKLENMTKEEIIKSFDIIVGDAIKELCLFDIMLKDWKRYKHTYDVLKSMDIVSEDLVNTLLNCDVRLRTDYEEEELKTLRDEIRRSIGFSKKKEM